MTPCMLLPYGVWMHTGREERNFAGEALEAFQLAQEAVRGPALAQLH